MLPRMWHIVALISSLLVSDADADALRQTAPNDLTLEAAREHLGAARVAGVLADVDPNLILSVAWHESRYAPTARTAEPGNKTSCGPMTPIPKKTCIDPDLMTGYLEGADHLRTWINAARGNMRAALLGYAGGYRMIKACAAGPVLVERGGRSVDLCDVVDVFLARASAIHRRLNDGRRTRS
jgi:hypothetical protein